MDMSEQDVNVLQKIQKLRSDFIKNGKAIVNCVRELHSNWNDGSFMCMGCYENLCKVANLTQGTPIDIIMDKLKEEGLWE